MIVRFVDIGGIDNVGLSTPRNERGSSSQL
jgi:hypothetical protein